MHTRETLFQTQMYQASFFDPCCRFGSGNNIKLDVLVVENAMYLFEVVFGYPMLLTGSNTDSLHPSTCSGRRYLEDFCSGRKL